MSDAAATAETAQNGQKSPPRPSSGYSHRAAAYRAITALVGAVAVGVGVALVLFAPTTPLVPAAAAHPVLRFEAPKSGVPDSGEATRVEFRAYRPDGTVDPGFGGTIATAGRPTVRYPDGHGHVAVWFVVEVDLTGVKDKQIGARACNGQGCSDWRREPPLTCACWTGPGGCPSQVLPTTPASGVCP